MTDQGKRQPAEIPIVVDWSSEPTPSAANHAFVAHTPNEFAILFADIVPFAGRMVETPGRGVQKGQQAISARLVSSVRMSPQTYFACVSAMASNWNKYVSQAEGGKNAPKFQLKNSPQQLDDA